MSFNIELFNTNLLATFANSLKDDYTAETKAFLETRLADKKERLKEIAEAVLDGSIDPKDIPMYAKGELDIVVSDLLTIALISATKVEAAINTVLDKFADLVNSLAPTKED